MILPMNQKQTKMHLIFITQVLHIFIVIVSSSDDVTITPLSSNTQNYTEAEIYNRTLNHKDESLNSCQLLVLEIDEFVMWSNGTAYVEAYNMTYNDTFYILRNGSLLVCNPLFVQDDEHIVKDHIAKSETITLVGLIISMICLSLHLVVFALMPDLRNLPGWNLAALCTSLLISYSLLMILATVKITDYKEICVGVASLIHFFLLSSILWMSIMSFDVFLSLLRATGSLRVSSTKFKLKKFTLYNICSFGIALIFTVLGLLANFSGIFPLEYKPEFEKTCWFSRKKALLAFFAAPVIVLTCLNFGFFAMCSHIIHTNKMKPDKNVRQLSLRRNYLLYFRLAVIMGITWIVGAVASIINNDWLWYIFVALNTLQGLFIFLAFTCSKKAIKFLRQKFKIIGGRRASEQTFTPTFQSYCFYANSIEKDLDKVMDNTSEKADTIVIHL